MHDNSVVDCSDDNSSIEDNKDIAFPPSSNDQLKIDFIYEDKEESSEDDDDDKGVTYSEMISICDELDNKNEGRGSNIEEFLEK